MRMVCLRVVCFVSLLGLVTLILGGASRAADANVPGDAERAAMAIERTLQRHGPEVHRCFEKALADRLDVAGRMEMQVEVGEGGKVTSARALSQGPDVAPSLSGCVLASANGWQVDGIEAGAALVLPLQFAAQESQFVVRTSDAPERGPVARPRGGGPAREPAFTVRILADPVNVKAQMVSLTLLSVAPASRVAMHRHPRSAKILYLLRGRARLLGPSGMPPRKLDPGTVVFLPAGYPHVIENMGRQARAVFLQAFSPPGPEKVYRDPTDQSGRADFEVIRIPGKARLPPPSHGRLVVRDIEDVKPVPILGGKATARIVLEEKVTGSPALALDLLEFMPGAEVPRHEHPGVTELLYILDGGGTLMVGNQIHKFGANELLHIPPEQSHGVRLATSERTLAIQIYSPAGPEQRFRTPATAAAPSAASKK
jgi:quercetin dioxygenase-like cupin family protein